MGIGKIMTGARREVKFSVLDPQVRREIKTRLTDAGCRVFENSTVLHVKYDDCAQQAILTTLRPHWDAIEAL